MVDQLYTPIRCRRIGNTLVFPFPFDRMVLKQMKEGNVHGL